MKKRVLSVILALCMVWLLLPAGAAAASPAESISLSVENGKIDVTVDSSAFLIKQTGQGDKTLSLSGTLTVTGTVGAQGSPSENSITVDITGQTLNLVVDDLHLIANGNSIDIKNGSVNMTLVGESAIKSHEMHKSALHIGQNAALTVTQASTGSIDVRLHDTNGWT